MHATLTAISPTSTPVCPGPRTAEGLAALASELNQLRDNTRAKVGEVDARYITRLLWVIRGLESAGRALLLGGFWMPTWWLGTALLGVSKCLENMEFGHNVMHGQYDWMNDPRFDGHSHDWDNACSKEDWRDFHNFQHHHFTNVAGVDRDFGYGMLRLSSETPWERRYLTQAPYTLIVGLLFEWAFAIHNLEFERLRTDRAATQARIQRLWPRARAKMGRQLRKDYLWWPLVGAVAGLAWGFFNGDAAGALAYGALQGALAVFTGNLVAGLGRNLWSFMVIFCGHFTDGVHLFEAESVATESKGQWYLRQILGSSNLRGGWLFHVMSGNLSHQIEHHLFPDLPARRYAELAPAVRDICARHGVPYNTGSLAGQFFTVMRRIVRHSLPGGDRLLLRSALAKPRSTPLTPG
jgi:fatty acid desaturase